MDQNNKYTEGFSKLNKDLALKGLLFAMVFYIINSPVITNMLKKNMLPSLETLAVQSIMFGVTFYLISIHL